MKSVAINRQSIFGVTSAWIQARDFAVSVAVGTVFTLGGFMLMAHFEQGKASRPAPVMEDFRAVSLPLEIPPPPVVQEEVGPVSDTITGIDVAAAESPVQIAVILPVLESLPPPEAPPAKIQYSNTVPEFKPKMEILPSFDHVFQQSEVDQRPTVLRNSVPFIPLNLHRDVKALRVEMIMVVDVNGRPHSVRLLASSGRPEFDELMLKCVQYEWEFTPAVKKGKKVKCLVQRAVTIRWTSSPFES